MAAPAAFPPKLADQLLSNDKATRLKAVDVFNSMPSDAKFKLVPDFMVALSSEDPKVRARAEKILKVLGVTPNQQAADPKALLQREREKLPDAPAVETVAVAPAQATGFDRTAAAEQMRLAKQEEFADLKAILAEEKGSSGYLDALGVREDDGIRSGMKSPILEALQDTDPFMRQRAARRLGEVRPPPLEAIPLLIPMLSDPDKDVRSAAAGALGGFGPDAREAVPALIRLLADGDPGVRQIAADAIRQIQPGYR